MSDPFYPGDDLIDAANEAIDLRREVEALRVALVDLSADLLLVGGNYPAIRQIATRARRLGLGLEGDE